jgi:RNHCP domain
VGNGYTNHCPKCLWSQHVDINPGDRSATCLGMMKPIGIENQKGEWVIIHECQICKYKKRNKVSSRDDIDVVAKIAKDVADRITQAPPNR